jgi:CubicO group peptidase (beta-lactamase class C family)
MRSRSMLTLLLFALATMSTTALAGRPDSTPAIARVEAGLRPVVVIKGAPPVAYTLPDRMAHYKVPGVSMAVVDGGRIAWARGAGVKQSGATGPVTPRTLFQAASISKPVTATAMLRLVAEGKLSLDAPVNDLLKSWKLPDNEFTATEKVTLRRIASHSAGLTVHGFPGYAVTDSLPTVLQILDGLKPANTQAVRVDVVPGTLSRYSGGGTLIEQLLMADVTGEPFPALLKRLVLDPIGMSDSAYDQPLAPARRGREAAGHRADGKVVEGRWHIYPELAPAGLWTTPTDLLKWAMEVAAARAGKSTKVLSRQMAAEMLTVQKEPFGIGPVLHGSGSAFYFEHSGGNEGFRCQVVYFPELGQGAAVMTNGDSGSALLREILYAFAAEYGWPEFEPREVTPVALDPAALERYVGSYVHATGEDGVRIVVSRLGERLYAEEAHFLPKAQLAFIASDKAIVLDSGFEIAFGTDASGAIDHIDAAGTTLRRETK